MSVLSISFRRTLRLHPMETFMSAMDTVRIMF